jgi:LytS/YehU family sensor histidine kinase
MLLFEFFFRKHLNWKKRPNTNLLISVLISGVYGVALMILVMKSLVWFFNFKESSLYEYTNNSIYAVLFAMLIGLVINGQEFLKQWKKSAEDNELMKKEALRSQYEILKSQVNPHFFFNALNTLSTLIPEQPEIAVSFVQQLSKVFRYSLEYKEEGIVNIETELKIVQSYLFLNKQRFGDKLIVNSHVDAGAMHLQIIAQSLLTLVENALKHNEISFLHPLHINIYNDRDEYLVVGNSFRPKELSEKSLGIGLPNIVDRYRLVTDSPVTVEKVNGMFTVKIPLLRNGHPDNRR